MSLLTQESAEKIVHRLRRIIPNPLRIMSTDGHLLAVSGTEADTKIHTNALRAVELQEAVIVYHDNEYEQQGISFPVRYNDRIEGVVEINGDIDHIMQMGQTVATLVELMIENNVYQEHMATRESRLNEFMWEWIRHSPDEYSQQFREAAEYFKVNLNLKRFAVIIRMRRIRYSVIDQARALLHDGEYIVRQKLNSFTLLMIADSNFQRRVKQILAISPDFEQACIGNESTDASLAVNTADQTLDVCCILKLEQPVIHFYEV